MKAKSEDEWQLALAEIANDPSPLAAAFQKFLVKWIELAEEQVETGSAETYFAVTTRDALAALRDTLHRAEEESGGALTIGFVGMAMVVISTQWAYTDPDEFYDALTSIEQNLFRDVATVKMLELNKQAQEPVVTIEDFNKAMKEHNEEKKISNFNQEDT